MKITKIEGKMGLDIKRLYIPYIVEDKCAECDTLVEIDFSHGEYLSYPKLESPTKIHFYCDECEHEWDRLVSLSLHLVQEASVP